MTTVDIFETLEAVLDKLYQKGIKLRKDKIKFMLREVEYNGFMISKNGIRLTENKVEAIHGAKAPLNVTEHRSFIGLANYIRSFVSKFAELVAPLYHLLKKDSKWKWGIKENESFNKIKNAICAKKSFKKL